MISFAIWYGLAGLETVFFGVVVFGARITLREALFAFLCWPYFAVTGFVVLARWLLKR